MPPRWRAHFNTLTLKMQEQICILPKKKLQATYTEKIRRLPLSNRRTHKMKPGPLPGRACTLRAYSTPSAPLVNPFLQKKNFKPPGTYAPDGRKFNDQPGPLPGRACTLRAYFTQSPALVNTNSKFNIKKPRRGPTLKRKPSPPRALLFGWPRLGPRCIFRRVRLRQRHAHHTLSLHATAILPLLIVTHKQTSTNTHTNPATRANTACSITVICKRLKSSRYSERDFSRSAKSSTLFISDLMDTT